MKTLVTPRLTMRPFTLDDVDVVHALWTDAAVRRYLWDDMAIPRERAEEMVRGIVAAFDRNGRGMWLVFVPPDDMAAGFCGFLPRNEPAQGELIYGLSPAAWGRGYATEAAAAVVDHGFTALGLERIVAKADVPNTASVRVLERLGMHYVRREVVLGVDLLFYEVERGAWANPAATASSRMPRR